MAARRRRRAMRGPSSAPTDASTARPRVGERFTSTEASCGSSPTWPPSFATAVARSTARPPQLAFAQPAAPGTRDATVELLEGIAKTLAIEAEGLDDDDAVCHVAYLIGDVLGTLDQLA